MRIQSIILLFFTGVLLLVFTDNELYGQGNGYQNHQQMSQTLRNLAQNHAGLATVRSLTRTAGNKDIWVFTIGTGDIRNKPAIALVGGTSGDHLLGTELAVQVATRLLQNSSDSRIRALLDSVVFYIFPDVSPDAREQFFAPLRYQRLGNASPSDLDRDGRTGEDPYNDLNGDGLITLMRVADPSGNWMPHPLDERILVPARPEKGEKGRYLVFSEGIDEDKEGQFNEDGPEGVAFNRNFTYRYPAFTRHAGEHAVSENETLAIADFLFAAKNVYAVMSFGDANNLTAPEKYNESAARGRIPSSWAEKDVKINEMVSHYYKLQYDTLAPKGARGSDGDFFQWAYYHYGRFSFSTQGWSIPEPARPGTNPSDELNFLNWAEQNNLTGVFVPWTPVQHPDFPGRQVEVGGIVPFAMKNPPYEMTASIADKHLRFLLDLADLRPRTDIINLKTEQIGRNLYRVTADIINMGHFPATSQMGERVRWVQKPVVRVTTGRNQRIVSGRAIEVIPALDARSYERRSWLIQGSGSIKIRAGSESTGFREIDVRL
jgi:hypothetical protein